MTNRCIRKRGVCLEAERDIVNAQIEDWEKQGIVRPSVSDFASLIVLVKKRSDSYRLCVDYRLLNKNIIKDRYPLPLIEDQLNQLQDSNFFSTLDLKKRIFPCAHGRSEHKVRRLLFPTANLNFC